MKSDRFKQGHVFRYPFRWKHEDGRAQAEPKQRPVCLVLKLPRPNGITGLAILPISDQPPEESVLGIEIPRHEIEAAGLSHFRNAYVHLREINIDRAENSYSFNPNTTILGRFSRMFLERIARQLVENIKANRVTRIDRN
jgi:hypothetical protein